MLSCLQYYQTTTMPVASYRHGSSSGLASLASGGSFWQGFASGIVVIGIIDFGISKT